MNQRDELRELWGLNDAIGEESQVSQAKYSRMVSDIKKRTEDEQERRGKSQAEMNELREKLRVARKKALVEEYNAELAHKALVKRVADGKRAEAERVAKAESARIQSLREQGKARWVRGDGTVTLYVQDAKGNWKPEATDTILGINTWT